MKSNGAILYQGPSRIDGKPVVAIVTGLKNKSANGKTGDMVQSWILRSDMHPSEALATGADVSICGGCPHRPDKKGKRSCYVNIMGPAAVYRAFVAGKYPSLPINELVELVSGRMVRLGSYGDPAAIPLAVWRLLVSKADGYTGYTHQWRSAKLRDVTELCQASVDTVEELAKAKLLGFGTFRVRALGEALAPGELTCPASKEAGKVTTCQLCGMCDGKSARNIVIAAHGSGARYVSERKGLPVLASA